MSYDGRRVAVVILEGNVVECGNSATKADRRCPVVIVVAIQAAPIANDSAGD